MCAAPRKFALAMLAVCALSPSRAARPADMQTDPFGCQRAESPSGRDAQSTKKPGAVNPTQARLLSDEAERLDHRVQLFRLSVIGTTPREQDLPALRDDVQVEQDCLHGTQRRFNALSGSKEPTSESNDFFADLNHYYENLMAEFPGGQRSGWIRAVTKPAAYYPSPQGKNSGPQPQSALALAHSFLDLLDKTAKAFKAVASSKSLLFDLYVCSDQPHVKVSLERWGDTQPEAPQFLPYARNNLVRAEWYLTFTRDDYKPANCIIEASSEEVTDREAHLWKNKEGECRQLRDKEKECQPDPKSP